MAVLPLAQNHSGQKFPSFPAATKSSLSVIVVQVALKIGNLCTPLPVREMRLSWAPQRLDSKRE